MQLIKELVQWGSRRKSSMKRKKEKKFIKLFVSYGDPKSKLSGVTGFSNLSESLQEQELSSAWLKSTV